MKDRAQPLVQEATDIAKGAADNLREPAQDVKG